MNPENYPQNNTTPNSYLPQNYPPVPGRVSYNNVNSNFQGEVYPNNYQVNNPPPIPNNYQAYVQPEIEPIPNKPLPLKITYDRSLGKRGKMIVAACILALSASFAFGFFKQKNIVQDTNKRNDIIYVIKGLNSYYKDSSEFMEKRSYPVANCSGELNSFDYEYTLRKALTGAGLNANSHSYIEEGGLPTDNLGKYTGSFSDYNGMNPKNADTTVGKLGVINCFNALPVFERESFNNKYFDNFRVCKFDNKIEPLKFDFFAQKNCYLYTTSKNGDTYRLSYYSNALKKYVVYSQYRNGNLSVVYSD